MCSHLFLELFRDELDCMRGDAVHLVACNQDGNPFPDDLSPGQDVVQQLRDSAEVRHEVNGIYDKHNSACLWKVLVQLRPQPV